MSTKTKIRNSSTSKPTKAYPRKQELDELVKIARTREAVQKWYFDTKSALDSLRSVVARMTARINTDPNCELGQFLTFSEICSLRNALDHADTELANISPISGGVDITDPVSAMDGDEE